MSIVNIIYVNKVNLSHGVSGGKIGRKRSRFGLQNDLSEEGKRLKCDVDNVEKQCVKVAYTNV